jgi:hypothetical protein
MKKVKGKIIITESKPGVPDLLSASYDLDPETEQGQSIGGKQMTVFDVCLRDENTGDLLLIDSASGRYIFIKCSTGYITSTSKRVKSTEESEPVAGNAPITFAY